MMTVETSIDNSKEEAPSFLDYCLFNDAAIETMRYDDCRSQWSSGLRHELSSLSRTLGS
jgi:hypothetical protein